MTVNALTHESAAAPVENDADFRTLADEAKRLRLGKLSDQEASEFVSSVRAAASKRPSEALARLIGSLLSEAALTLDTERGRKLRGGLVQAQLALGFPWALEMAPEDLALAHPKPARFLGGRIALGFFATLSVAWNGAWGVGTLSDWNHEGLVPLYFIVGALHAMVSWYAAAGLRSRRLYRCLGLLVLCGPAFSVLQMLRVMPHQSGETLVLGLIFAVPAMLTALVSLVISAAMPGD